MNDEAGVRRAETGASLQFPSAVRSWQSLQSEYNFCGQKRWQIRAGTTAKNDGRTGGDRIDISVSSFTFGCEQCLNYIESCSVDQALESWKTQLVSLGLFLAVLTYRSLSSGFAFFSADDSIDKMLMHTLSTFSAGLHPPWYRIDRQMCPLL